MKKYIIVLIGALVALCGCKTNEKNYRAAYEVAKEKFDNEGGLDSTIYNRMRPQGRGSELTALGDTVRMHTISIGFPKEGGASRETVKTYCVVVAQFKQIFNAKAMRQRLVDNGYDGAMIVNTREPLYYVVAGSVATPEEAVTMMRQLRKDKALVLRDPFPWVLRPSYLAR